MKLNAAILVACKASFRNGGLDPHWNTGPVRVMAPTVSTMFCMTLRLVAFNLFEREVKNINFDFCYAQAL